MIFLLSKDRKINKCWDSGVCHFNLGLGCVSQQLVHLLIHLLHCSINFFLFKAHTFLTKKKANTFLYLPWRKSFFGTLVAVVSCLQLATGASIIMMDRSSFEVVITWLFEWEVWNLLYKAELCSQQLSQLTSPDSLISLLVVFFTLLVPATRPVFFFLVNGFCKQTTGAVQLQV